MIKGAREKEEEGEGTGTGKTTPGKGRAGSAGVTPMGVAGAARGTSPTGRWGAVG